MDKFTSKQLFQIYKIMGLDDPKFFDGNDVVNLFKVLGIEPKFNQDGSRQKTPYEILQVLPVFKNGKERPIVFAIKNHVSKIGRYEGQLTKFVYQKSKVKEQKPVLETLKEKYRAAIMAGDDEQADSCLKMIDELTHGRASEFRDSFYDYSKFYRRMKKQLMLDLFAHFFLMYVQRRSSLIKNGLIMKNKIYKPYKENMNAYNQNVTYDADMEVVSMTPAVDPIAFGLQNVKKVVIKDKEMENVAEFNIGAKGIEVKTRQDLFVNVSAAQEPAPQTMQTTKVTAFGVGNSGMKDSQENHKQEQVDETETSFFKPFVKKRKKALRRVGSVPQNIQEYGDGEDESIPFSKKEKQEQRYKEREIEG